MTSGNGFGATRAAAELCRRYLRRIKFTALTHLDVLNKLADLKPRLDRKGYYVRHYSFDGYFSRRVWIEGREFFRDAPEVKHLVDKALATVPQVVTKVIYVERPAPAQQRQEKEVRLSDRVRKWKAAYDALRELGIRF